MTAITYDPVEVGRRAARLAEPSGFIQQITMPTWIVECGTGERAVPVAQSAG